MAANEQWTSDTFREALKRRHGFEIEPMAEDGNCLFRAVAHQVWCDPEKHDLVRRQTMDWMARNREHFMQFVAQDFDAYVARKRQLRVYGDHPEIHAMSEIYGRPIEVYSSDYRLGEPLNTFQGRSTDGVNAPIRLSYHDGNHYNSVVDPNNPTFGVGLGLPDYHPGLADKLQMDRAKLLSEYDDMENKLYDAMVFETAMQESAKELNARSDRDVEAALRASERELLERQLNDEALLASALEQSSYDNPNMDEDEMLQRALLESMYGAGSPTEGPAPQTPTFATSPTYRGTPGMAHERAGNAGPEDR